MIEITYTIAIAALFIASISDLRTREVPDWLNYGLIFSGLFVNFIFSAVYWDYRYALNSIIGLGIFLVFSYIMFYTGQWGGGDSKMLMGLGALIGIDSSFKSFPFMASFLLNTLIVGAVYGFFWSISLAIKNRKKFLRKMRNIFADPVLIKVRRIIMLSSLILIASLIFITEIYLKVLVFSLVILFLMTFYLWVFVKAVENSCMLKYVLPTQLTEGDWIAKEVKIGGKYITGPKDLGISKKSIKKLVNFYKAGKIKKILIKEGIPFVPSFFMAFILTLIAGNFVFWFVG